MVIMEVGSQLRDRTWEFRGVTHTWAWPNKHSVLLLLEHSDCCPGASQEHLQHHSAVAAHALSSDLT
jgi:hypothetical protein